MRPEQALADAAERVTHLRIEGHPVQAASLERLAGELREAMTEYLTWLDEPAAVLYTGRSKDYLRIRFPKLLERDLAEWHQDLRSQVRSRPQAVSRGLRRGLLQRVGGGVNERPTVPVGVIQLPGMDAWVQMTGWITQKLCLALSLFVWMKVGRRRWRPMPLRINVKIEWGPR